MSLLNNSSLLSSTAFKRSFVIVRRIGGYDTATGEWVEGVASSTNATGSVQPMRGASLARLRSAMEGGARITDAITIYTTSDITAGAISTNSGDEIQIDGLNWSVVKSNPWTANGYIKAIGVRLDGQND